MKKILFAIFFSTLILLTFTSCNNSDNIKNNGDNLFKKNHTVSLCVDKLSEKEITVDDGEVLIIDFIPQKSDYLFSGWYSDSMCTVPYDFSRPVTTSFKLYAGFILTSKTIYCQDINIKALSMLYDNDKSFYLSLAGFDYDYLEKYRMGLRFTIMYSVKYKKDYDVLWDIGYTGAPKYEISLVNNYLETYIEMNLPTTKKEVRNSYTYITPLIFSKDKQISLFFSTDNVQNIISFSDIVVVIDAIKVS